MKPKNTFRTISRRGFIKSTSAFLASVSLKPSLASIGTKEPILTFGIVTDLHYADTLARGTRYFQESLYKLTECVNVMNELKVDFLIELGDFKDQDEPADEAKTLEYLETIEGVFKRFKGRRYHVLGNHDMDSISKQQFLTRVENTGIPSNLSYYSFDLKGVHFVILDANYNDDGSDYDHGNFEWTDTRIPAKQLEWLQTDLAGSQKPTVVFVHQQLDQSDSDPHSVNNATEVRSVLRQSGQVLAVFQGHQHAGGSTDIDGIYYYTLKAMVEGKGPENNSFALVKVYKDTSILITGYRKAVTEKFKPDSR